VKKSPVSVERREILDKRREGHGASVEGDCAIPSESRLWRFGRGVDPANAACWIEMVWDRAPRLLGHRVHTRFEHRYARPARTRRGDLGRAREGGRRDFDLAR